MYSDFIGNITLLFKFLICNGLGSIGEIDWGGDGSSARNVLNTIFEQCPQGQCNLINVHS